jgi:AraC-like DNA-binding protein
LVEGGVSQPVSRNSERDRLGETVTAMRRNPHTPHTVSDFARLAGMSRSNFAQAFRARFGRSPMEFMRGVRLDHAADLLRNSNIPIKTVVTRCGYNSRTSFSHAFRQSFGVSPVAFRDARAWRSSNDIHAISERLRQFSGRAQELAWEVDITTGRVWWSEGTFSALGFTADAGLICDVARFYERIHLQDRERVVLSIQHACAGDSLTWDERFLFKTAAGAYVLIRNGSVILRNSDGGATRLIGAMQIAGLET